MTDDKLRAAAEALLASTLENGDPFNGGDWETVQVARWALALLRERDALRAALEPFAAFASGWHPNWPDHMEINETKTDECPTLGDCRVAAALLAGKGVPPC